jgi:phospholipid transport system substrate-binding protein
MNNHRTIKNHFIGLSFLAMCLCFFSCVNVAFAESRPESILDSATKSMLSSLKENKQTLKQNPNGIYKLVDDVLVPHVDTEYMAKWVIGKQYWTSATADQQRRFITEFKRMVVRSYASSLLTFSDQTVTYFPVKESLEGKSKVQVSSVIRQPNGENINVAYRLLRTSNDWKVYDIVIEGVSLLQGFKSQFADDLRAAGLEQLINKLHAHNAKPLNTK